MSKPNKREFRAIITLFYSIRGTCDRLKTATTLWTPEPENRLLGGGYNGAPSGVPSCDEIGHLMDEGHCIRTIHGEKNAILNCFNPERLFGGTAVVLGTPCYKCAVELVQVKVKKIEYYGTYANSQGAEHIRKLFEDAKVEWYCYPAEELMEFLKKGIGVLQSAGGALKDFPNSDFIFTRE